MLFRSLDFRRLGGFDEGFYLYYEGVDICLRAWKRGMKVAACTDVDVIHDARRRSRRNLRHLRAHLASLVPPDGNPNTIYQEYIVRCRLY